MPKLASYWILQGRVISPWLLRSRRVEGLLVVSQLLHVLAEQAPSASLQSSCIFLGNEYHFNFQ
jgi:hypothetical protein